MTRDRRRAAAFASLLSFAALTAAASIARAQDADACIAASDKALALRKSGKLIEARASLSTCAASTCPDAVSASCRQRLADLNESIPSVVFLTKDESGHDVASVKLTIDGVLYTDHLDGRTIVLDPGEHDFRFEVPGKDTVVRRLILHARERRRLEEVTFGAEASASHAPTPVPVPATAAPTEVAHVPANTQRTAGLVVVGVGVAGLAVGAIFGGLALGAHSTYEQNCGSNIGAPSGRCNAAGVSGESDAATKGSVSTVAFVVGGLAVAGGAVLYFTAPAASIAPQLGLTPGGLLVRGRF